MNTIRILIQAEQGDPAHRIDAGALNDAPMKWPLTFYTDKTLDDWMGGATRVQGRGSNHTEP